MTKRNRKEFSPTTKLAAWDRSKGYCERCDLKLFGGNVEYDHINPDYFDGGNQLSNCKVLCKHCHGLKTNTKDKPNIAKSKRVQMDEAGILRRKGPPMPGTKASGYKKHMDGRVTRR